jgi:membrane fusion protein (multidrug efflux system)
MTTNAPDDAVAPQGPLVPLPASRRRPVLLALGALAALVLAVLAARALRYAHGHESTDDAQVDGHIVPVLARVGGYVTAVAVEDNATVKEGAVLVRIDSTEYAIRLAQADADVAAVTAALAQTGAALESATQQLAVAQAQVDAARAAADRTRADLARAQELAATQVVSRQALDAAQAAKDAAEANLEAARRQAGAATAAIAVAGAGQRAAAARLEAARAARQSAGLQLSYTRVVAPASGTIAKRSVEVGQLLQAGQPLLAVVSDTATWVTANFKETQLDDMRVGQKAEVDIDSYPGCRAVGTVESLSPATGARFALLPPDNATGNYTKVVQRIPVRIHVDRGCGPSQPLRPGLSAVVHVATR